MEEKGQEKIINLLRCAWAGSQRYGALVWSGDIASSFESMRNQLAAGLNMGIAGIPWWTTDIGGFHGGNPDNEDFRELFVRWFQWATFCPVMRLHGDRDPMQPPIDGAGEGVCHSGAANEVWSYGEEVYEICKKYIALREKLRPYTRKLMEEAHEKGSPIIRTLFYEFPEDELCWEIEDEYMYGDEILVAPILEANAKERRVYLPSNAIWENPHSGVVYEGGRWIDESVTIQETPYYIRKKAVNFYSLTTI
jgi:alpha-D-xyloside xylohydrolase